MQEILTVTGTEAEQSRVELPTTVDWGSTDVKIAFYLNGIFTESWTGYIAKKTRIGNTDNYLSLLTGDKLNHLSEKIKQKFPDNSLEGVCLTGAKNPLWIRYQNNDYIILDDPSPTTPISPDLMQTINCVFGTNLTDIEYSSALYKMIQLKHNAEYRRAVFGEDVNFADMKFGSVNGYVATLISDQKHSFFDSDISGLGVNGCSSEKIRQMLNTLGVVENKQYSVNENTKNFLVMDDFGAETQITKMLIDQGLIDRDAILIAWDSIAKIMAANNPNCGFEKQKNGMF